MSDDPKVHPKFNAADADVSILSSDGVLFRIHSINLKINSTAFPEDIVTNPNDLATFSEPSKKFALLFAFLYSSPPHPTLTDLSFTILRPLAYAAHKYGVASAISVCNIMMIDNPRNRDNNRLSLLKYACLFMLDDEKRLGNAARSTLSSKATSALAVLDPDVFAAWVIYRDQWIDVNEASSESSVKNVTYKDIMTSNRGSIYSFGWKNFPPKPIFKKCLAVVHENRKS